MQIMKVFEGLFAETEVVGRFGVKRLVGECLTDGTPLVEEVFGGFGEVGFDKALPQEVYRLGGGMQHIGSIKAVVAEFVHQDFIGGEISNDRIAVHE